MVTGGGDRTQGYVISVTPRRPNVVARIEAVDENVLYLARKITRSDEGVPSR
jgi:hypothetical protein